MITIGNDLVYGDVTISVGTEKYTLSNGGLTKRELFAAMAMQGFCLQATGAYEKGPCNAAIVRRSVLLSDLLIEELNKDAES